MRAAKFLSGAPDRRCSSGILMTNANCRAGQVGMAVADGSYAAAPASPSELGSYERCPGKQANGLQHSAAQPEAQQL